MSMATSKAVLQVFFGTVPRTCCSDSFVHKLDSAYPLNSHIRCVKKLVTRNRQFLSCSSMLQKQMGIYRFQGVDCGGLQHLIYKCHRAESVNETTADDGNGTWFVDSAKKLMPTNRVMDTPTVPEFEDVQECKPGNKGFASNGTVGTSKNPFSKVNIDSLEEEAWDLLRESMVYYCGSPIGTIAAKDPTSSNVLNYDHVFIHDFIPSGIAFLLKGEYDIVRNFILHTLQLQSCNGLP